VTAGVLEGRLDFFTRLGRMVTITPMISTAPASASNARTAARGESIRASLGGPGRPFG
jgi:hypothetical protein